MSAGRRRGVVMALAVALAGCATAEPPVPRFTVGGNAPSSLAPSEVLPARRAAGIQDCPVTDPKATQRPGGLPAVVLDCLGGDRSVNLAGLGQGRPMVVNVWAQWCGPCITEAPMLVEAHQQLGYRVDFIGLNYSDPWPEKVVGFARHSAMTYPQVVDPDEKARVPLKITALPQTLFIDADGRIVHRELKPFTSADQVVQMVSDKLGVAP